VLGTFQPYLQRMPRSKIIIIVLQNGRLSWPGRQAVRCASDHTQLEHNPCGRANFERPG
jgi:hypothetical protein